MKYFKAFTILLTSLMLLFSCSSEDDQNEGAKGETTNLSIQLIDAPGDYDKVNIEIKDVMLRYHGNPEEISLNPENAGIHDLLKLTGGVSISLADKFKAPVGRILHMRLVMGENNSIVVDGETFPLQLPSEEEYKLTKIMNKEINAGVDYDYILDFDVHSSVVKRGEGDYILKPSITESLKSETGVIKGKVLMPNMVQSGIKAVNVVEDPDDRVEIRTFTNAQGEFQLFGLPEGNYSVTIQPEVGNGYSTVTLHNIDVLKEEVVVLDNIDF